MRLLFSTMTLSLCLGTAGMAQTSITDGVVAALEAEGYTVSDIRRSWLGRIVVTANGESGLREVVLNRASGQVLRDQVFPGARDGQDRPEGRDTPDRDARDDGRDVPDDRNRDERRN